MNFDQKQIFVRYWSYCFINLFFILRPMYTSNGMTILEDIPLVLHSLLKTRKHRLAIISAGSRTKCSQFHYPLHRGVRKGFGNNLVCCKGNWSCLHSRCADPSAITSKVTWCCLQLTHSFSINIKHEFIISWPERNWIPEKNWMHYLKIWKFSILAADL